jgi:hypothetical protein
MANGNEAPATDRRIDVVLAEYAWASHLLPFYRQVEMTALGAASVILSAVISVVAALAAGARPDPAAEATLLSASAWAPTILLLIEIMALARIRRAALYIRRYIGPLLRDLLGDERLLQWEELSSAQIFFPTGEVSELRRRTVAAMVSSFPIVFGIGSMSVALAVAGATIHPGGPIASVLFIGYSATFVSLCLAATGIMFTWRHEEHEALNA